MKRSSVAIVMLAVGLVGSNAFWAYNTVDNGVSYTYLDASYQSARSTAVGALAALPAAARNDATPASVIEAVRTSGDGSMEPFEKDGFTWVGGLGLRFGPDGRLVAAQALMEPF